MLVVNTIGAGAPAGCAVDDDVPLARLVERHHERAVGVDVGDEVLESADVESDQHDVQLRALRLGELGDPLTVGALDVEGGRDPCGLALVVDEHVAVDLEARRNRAGLDGPVGVRPALRVARQLPTDAVRRTERARDDEQERTTVGRSRCAASASSLRPQKAFDCLRCLVDEMFGAIVVAAGGCTGDAVVQVLVEQLHADALQRLADGGDLGEHVDAVRVVLDHPTEAADLALDAAQPRQQLLLVVGVSRERVHIVDDTP